MKKIKLHLGCGKRNLGKDWIHIDLADFPHIDYKTSISDLPMFSLESVDEIYCCHALEYLGKFEAEYALREWYRVLKKGGILRLAVPDFEGIIKVYEKYGDIEHKGILGPLFGCMQQNDKTIYHKTVYDFNRLKKLLGLIGFKNVKKYDVVEYFKTLPKGYDDQSFAFIPEMNPKGICVSLNVVCKK